MTHILQPLVIVGAGGFGREVLDIVEDLNSSELRYRILGFVDDGSPNEERIAARGQRLLGGVDALANLDARYVLAVGSGTARASLDSRIRTWGHEPVTLMHPSCTMGSLVDVGQGTVLAPGARVTTNVRLGRHAQLHQNATIGHDTVASEYVTLMPGANVSGGVRIGRESTIGTGASVIQGLTVGARTFVGAGASVIRDLPSDVTAVGVPARPLTAVRSQ